MSENGIISKNKYRKQLISAKMDDMRQLPYPVDFRIEVDVSTDISILPDFDKTRLSVLDEEFTPESCAQKISSRTWIAKGTYANIYRYSKEYSLKVYNSSLCKMLDTSIELYALTQLNHSSILKCKYATSKNESIILMMPHYDHTLSDMSPTTDIEKESVMKQLVSGVQYLHSRKILHLDLSPRNILVRVQDGCFKVVICDFSLSCVCVGDSFSSRTPRITSDYRPYENLTGLKRYTKKSDIWSLGVIFYRIETGEYLFSFGTVPRHKPTYTDYDLSVRFEIEKRQLWGKWPPVCNARVRKMLCLDPEERIDSNSLCNLYNVKTSNEICFEEKDSSILPNWKYLSKFYKKVDRFTIPQVDHLFRNVKDFFASKNVSLTLAEENKIFLSCYGIVKSCTTELSSIVNKTSLDFFDDIFSIFCAVNGKILSVKTDNDSTEPT